jgi:hypothetical protein
MKLNSHDNEDAESSTALFEEGGTVRTTMKPIKKHSLETSDKVASKEQASTHGGEYSEIAEHGNFPSVMDASDDEPHLTAFIFGDMVEHGVVPSTKATHDNDYGDICAHIERVSDHH